MLFEQSNMSTMYLLLCIKIFEEIKWLSLADLMLFNFYYKSTLSEQDDGILEKIFKKENLL